MPCQCHHIDLWRALTFLSPSSSATPPLAFGWVVCQAARECWRPAPSFGVARPSLRLPLALEKGGFGQYATHGTCVVCVHAEAARVIYETRQDAGPKGRHLERDTPHILLFFSTQTFSKLSRKLSRVALLKTNGRCGLLGSVCHPLAVALLRSPKL